MTKGERLDGRTITVTCLGTMTDYEAMDFMAEQIARIYHDEKEEQTNE